MQLNRNIWTGDVLKEMPEFQKLTHLKILDIRNFNRFFTLLLKRFKFWVVALVSKPDGAYWP